MSAMTLQALAAKIDTKLVDSLETLKATIPSLDVDADFLNKYGGKLMDEKAPRASFRTRGAPGSWACGKQRSC